MVKKCNRAVSALSQCKIGRSLLVESEEDLPMGVEYGYQVPSVGTTWPECGDCLYFLVIWK